jgi:DNA-binding transcriptional LysR family regulator
MEWQQLRGFHFVAKERSFTKAAKLTYRTQSALSQQIKSLEQEFGCTLFDRTTPRKISLTAEGERLFEFSEEVLSKFEVLKEDMYAMQGQPIGNLKFAAPFTTLTRLFPEILSSFTEKFPFVKFKVLDRHQSEAIRLVQRGEVDFCVALQSSIPETLKSISWKKVHFVLMVPSNHPLTKFKRLTVNQIAKYPLILPPQNMLLPRRKRFIESLKNASKDFQVVMESSNVELSSIYVEKGLGISIASVIEGLELLNNRELQFISLDNHLKPEQLSLVMRKRTILSGYKKSFIDLVLKPNN